MTKLKNCPFCEGEISEPAKLTFGWRVNCLGKCGSDFTLSGQNYEAALKVWNTRTPDPQIESLTAQLEEAKENQRVAIKALEKIENDFYCYPFEVAQQALSTIRGK